MRVPMRLPNGQFLVVRRVEQLLQHGHAIFHHNVQLFFLGVVYGVDEFDDVLVIKFAQYLYFSAVSESKTK